MEIGRVERLDDSALVRLENPAHFTKFGKEGLTFDDVLLVPAESAVLPNDVSTATRLTRTIALEIPDRLGGNGHRHRGADGDRARPRGRDRDRAPEPLDRRPGGRGGQGQALRVGDDRRAADAAAHCARRGRPRVDGALPRLRRADHRGRRAPGRDPHQPRPAIREGPQAARVGADDLREPRDRAGGDDPRRGRAPAPPPPHREAAGGGRRRVPARADHRQGHLQAHRVSLLDRRTRMAACVSARRSASAPTPSTALRRS